MWDVDASLAGRIAPFHKINIFYVGITENRTTSAVSLITDCTLLGRRKIPVSRITLRLMAQPQDFACNLDIAFNCILKRELMVAL